MKKVLVGLSGGVDSAVAAYLLKKQGYDVTAGFMINYLDEENPNCSTKIDLQVAKEVAKFLEIPFFTFDYRENYEEKVLNYMYEGYKKGITPNPDVWCNKEIKFKMFLDEAIELGFDYIATGHYARIERMSEDFYQMISEENIIVKDEINKRDKGQEQNPPTPPLSRGKKQVSPLHSEGQESVISSPVFGKRSVGKTNIEIGETNQTVIPVETGIYKKGQDNSIDPRFREDYKFYAILDKSEIYLKDFKTNLDGNISNNGNLSTHYSLLKGVDKNKDQSYFLAFLNQFQLSKSIFPIGNLEKKEVRKIALEIGLPNAERKDSQGICFVGKVNFKEFLEKKIKPKEGNIIDTTGKVLGKHKGVYYYTIGQRKGIDIGGLKEPIFVIKKDIKNNVLVVGTDKDLELYSKNLCCDKLHFINPDFEKLFNLKGQIIKAKAKIRYRQVDQDVKIEKLDDGTYEFNFKESQRAIAAGQVIAVYIGEELVASGIIN